MSSTAPIKQNAFTLPAKALAIRPTRVSKKAATRINKHRHIGSYLTNSEKAPR